MYLGNNLVAANSAYRLIDSLTSSFNGTTTSFALTVNSVTPVPFPLNEQNVLISVGGVPQKPDPTGAEGFKFSGTNIVFSSAPKTGEAFWGVVLAGADYVNVGVSYPDGAAATPSITFNSNKTTGIYLSGVSTLGFTTAGVLRSTIDSNGNLSILSAGSATIPAVAVGTGTTYAPGIYSPGTDQVAISTNGTQRATIDSSGNFLVGGTSSTVWNGGTTKKVLVLTNPNASGANAIFSAQTNSTTVDSGAIFEGYASSVTAGSAALGSIAFLRENTSNTALSSYTAFYTNNAGTILEKMRIDSSGRLLVGTSTALSGHSFYEATSGIYACYFRQAHASNPLGIVVNYSSASPNGTGNAFFEGNDSTTARFVARSNGGLANYSANNANLSDINTKKDISPAADTWNCLKEWEIVNYRYKDQPDDADLNLGVIAQQVAESCPEVITIFQEAKEATEDAPAREERLGVKEQQMYWMAIKALQEAQIRIEQLETKVAALEGA